MSQDNEGKEITAAKGKTQVWRDGKLVIDDLKDGAPIPGKALINEAPTQSQVDAQKAAAEAASKKSAAKAAASKKAAGK